MKRTAAKWIGTGLVIGILYMTGLHTTVIAGLQRAMLYSGFFDARVTDVANSDGPFLHVDDYTFAMQSADGTHDSLENYQGQVTFVNVWASWCPPCLAEMPTIETLHAELADYKDIRFILLSVDQDQEAAEQFMGKNNYKMPYRFPASPIPAALQSSVLPTTFVISREGQVVYVKEGIADYSAPAFRDWLIELDKTGDEQL